MQDDEITLLNACSNLVTLRKSEAFVRHLLTSRTAGEWIGVRECCVQTGVACGELAGELFVTWLADPMGQDGYVVILFYESESKWSMAAHYNRSRLLARISHHRTCARPPELA
jgi:hypothetical protein